jgi:dipeptidyl aminopeptidase/acylaminoacyl peptidase
MISIDQLLAIKPIPGHESPRWMPDGKCLVFVSGLGGRVDLWGITPEGGCPVRLSVGMGGVGHLAASLFAPSPDGRFIAYVSQKSGAYEVWLWAADGEPDRQLTRLGSAIESLAWSPDSSAVVISANRYGTYDIYRVDVPHGKTHSLTSDPRYEVYASFTPDGRDILYVRLDERWVDHEIVRMGRDGANPRVIARDENFFDYHYGRTFGYPTPSPDGEWIAFRSHRSGWITCWAVPANGGEARELAPQEADQEGGAWSPDGAWFAYTSNTNGTVDLRIVPADGGEPRVLVSPDTGVVSHPQWSPDSSQLSFLLATPTGPNDLHVVDIVDGRVTRLTDSAVGATASMLATPEKIAYPSFDGETIHAYLYRPRTIGVPANGAGVLFIHGGPTSQFMDTFQPQVQFFVQRGYTLLLPNPRGSSGYGRRFEDLNNGDWGHGDLHDVIFGAEELKKLDDVDPDKMAITGTSDPDVGVRRFCAHEGGAGAAPYQAAGVRIRASRAERGGLSPLLTDFRGDPGDDPLFRHPRHRQVPPVRRRQGVRPGPGTRVQDVCLQDLSGRNLLRRLNPKRATDAAGHGQVFPALPRSLSRAERGHHDRPGAGAGVDSAGCGRIGFAAAESEQIGWRPAS